VQHDFLRRKKIFRIVKWRWERKKTDAWASVFLHATDFRLLDRAPDEAPVPAD